eukprot:gene7585-17_t
MSVDLLGRPPDLCPCLTAPTYFPWLPILPNPTPPPGLYSSLRLPRSVPEALQLAQDLEAFADAEPGRVALVIFGIYIMPSVPDAPSTSLQTFSIPGTLFLNVVAGVAPQTLISCNVGRTLRLVKDQKENPLGFQMSMMLITVGIFCLLPPGGFAYALTLFAYKVMHWPAQWYI